MVARAEMPWLANFPVHFQSILNIDKGEAHSIHFVTFAFHPVESRILNAQLRTCRDESSDAVSAVGSGKNLYVEFPRGLGQSCPKFSLNPPMEAILEFVDEEYAFGCRSHRQADVEHSSQAVAHCVEWYPAFAFNLQQSDARCAPSRDVVQVLNARIDQAKPTENPLLTWSLYELIPKECGSFVAKATCLEMSDSEVEYPATEGKVPPRNQCYLVLAFVNGKRKFQMIDCQMSRKRRHIPAHTIFICD